VVEAPRLVRRLFRWIWALGLLSLLGAAGWLMMVWEPRQLPVRVVTVDGTVKHLKPRHLQETVVAHLDCGMLFQDLSKLKEAVEALPWVRSASLRRHWPDRLELAVVERLSLARWGEDALVCADGVVFRPEDGDLPRGLPKLSGRDENALQVVKRFRSWGSRLATLGVTIEELILDARGAWTLRLSNGLSLALGTAEVDERFSRFLRVYPKLVLAGIPSLVDMRYSNGLAIRWSAPAGDGPGSGTGAVSRSAQFDSRPSGVSRS
jgi:cell division protein FtsQ